MPRLSISTFDRYVCCGVLVSVVACSNANDSNPPFARAELLKPETCKGCHEQHFAEWSGSMHAYASVDPVFRAMNARGQRETGGKLGDFCVKCHAPLAVREEATTDGLNLDDLAPELQGITCYFCHNAKSVEGTHNNPLELSGDVTLRAAIDGPVHSAAHTPAYSTIHDANKPTESSQLCGACHDIVVPAALSGGKADVPLERTFLEWQDSLFNVSPKGQLSCSNCHMKIEANVRVSSAPGAPVRAARHMHDFPGVDVALTEFPQAKEQRDAVERSLDTTLRVEVCVSQLGDMSVSLENRGAGHNVPSGAAQDRRLWVELRAYSSMDPTAPVYTAGVPTGSAVETIEQDPSSWVLRDHMFDAADEPTHMFWNAARTDSKTLLAPLTTNPLDPSYHREVKGKKYRFTGPQVSPSRVTVTLRMTPIGRDVLDNLVESGDLQPSVRDAVPVFTLVPNRASASSDPVTLEWTMEKARKRGYSINDSLCVETSPPRQ